MKELGTEKKVIAVNKFITSYYPEVVNVEITYNDSGIPQLDVYYNQEDTRIANDSIISRERVIRDVGNYLGYKLVNPHMLDWEKRKEEFQNPDMFIKTHPLNLKYINQYFS